MFSLKSSNCILLSLLLVAPATRASMSCGEHSPLFEELGDRYFDADILPSSAAPSSDLSPDQLFDALNHFSLNRGVGEHTVCVESDTGTTLNSVDVSIEEIDIQIHGAEVLISALEVHSAARESHREKIEISVDNRHVTIVNENELVESRRMRHTTGVGSRFEEIRLALRRVETGVNVQQLRYVNGELAEWVDWLLMN